MIAGAQQSTCSCQTLGLKSGDVVKNLMGTDELLSRDDEMVDAPDRPRLHSCKLCHWVQAVDFIWARPPAISKAPSPSSWKPTVPPTTGLALK